MRHGADAVAGMPVVTVVRRRRRIQHLPPPSVRTPSRAVRQGGVELVNRRQSEFLFVTAAVEQDERIVGARFVVALAREPRLGAEAYLERPRRVFPCVTIERRSVGTIPAPFMGIIAVATVLGG